MWPTFRVPPSDELFNVKHVCELFFKEQIWSSCLPSTHLYLFIFGFWSLKQADECPRPPWFVLHASQTSRAVLSVKIAIYALLSAAKPHGEYSIPPNNCIGKEKSISKRQDQESKSFCTATKYYVTRCIPLISYLIKVIMKMLQTNT